ncbi:MAG TPA: TlpA disulfide reductase family protein [Syntrophales bacterium]|jgi:peroxiredoxin|nr:TlpA disulfide reductase family protein [Syntrophales bacterium]HPX56179.1 TlpA disulfide reductase family protein [Syntrophales bacterium]HQA82316.1 TlpA disulfide reductase family protein [Syntrophales bacterium]
MKKIVILSIVSVLLALWTGTLAAAPPKVGGPLSDITLSAPKDSGDKDYLGWGWGNSFKIPEIKAPYVLIEIFSMYCPYCQGEAPNVNKLYAKIQANPKLKDKIRLIGIGVGNTAFEVNTFRTRYKIPFPLFPDADYVIHKQVGEVRTPYFIGVKINADGTTRILYSQLGVLGDVDQFLTQFMSLTDLK